MSATNCTLPTLGSELLDLNYQEIAEQWFIDFAEALEYHKVDSVVDLFISGDVFWRDTLALTWDFRTFRGIPAIRKFLADQLHLFTISSVTLRTNFVTLERPFSDVAWIQGFFDFETTIGLASGIFRLVPLSDGTWKAHAVYTNLEDLKGHPEQNGPLRDHRPNHGKWASKRAREIEFLDEEPKVLIVGGGQGGLAVAARLKMHGLNALVVEKNERIGDNWRKRYAALCLNGPVWFQHMPYIPFPITWPVYIPAIKFGDWLESYAHSLELNVWTSATVTNIATGSKKRWRVLVNRQDGREREFEVDHVVCALGVGGSVPRMPEFSGMEDFRGQILHSSKHTQAMDYVGKKIVVIGACNSAHDICADFAEHGIDVTMYQRNPTYIMSMEKGNKKMLAPLFWEGGPPTEIADRIYASFPNPLMSMVQQRIVQEIAEVDKELLDGLRARGFKLLENSSGFLQLAWNRAGGYYLNVGASDLIVDGSIKLKSDSFLSHFTHHGLVFEDGSSLDADVVIFATGFSDARSAYRALLGEELGSKVTRMGGLDEEGEHNGLWREVGLPGLWCMTGPLVMARTYSKHVALQIKAQEEGLFGIRYR
ncbi:FAD/NAD(P)-binding domain-containing protein [Hygrophoropsis aurantiaca]|uniref:FAD/NAD(P)-binding domain-containing protein n=1 Tax=Hygrophoropsis aurantiaca TaxID=72124 RepID=A0ACB8AIZ1_9AGAM|nr:FAD/NAD(P)-binding domain-containing protein [Hygrophoropsis aurantiaca]